MPRELTELMERAVAHAPEEPHLAGDITRLAERRQRRRTTWLAAGVAAAMVVAGVAGYGVTRKHATTPEPIGPWKYGQHHTLSDATASADAPWFHIYDYPVPSVLPGRGDLAPVAEYLDVDPHGRLLTMRARFTGVGTHDEGTAATYAMVDGPQGPVRALPSPYQGLVLEPEFTADDGLLWPGPGVSGDHVHDWVTDLRGGNTALVRFGGEIPGGKTVGGHPVVASWWEGGRMWLSAVTKDDFPGSRQWVSLFSFDPAHPTALRAEKPHDVVALDVGGGTAVWLDGTTVRAEDLATAAVRTVPVPIDAGCHVLSADDLSGLPVPAYLSTDGDLVSLVEQCQRSWHLVVTDLAGRVVADVDSGTDDFVVRPTLTGDLVVFAGGGYVKGAGPMRSYALDLRSGRFVRLGDRQRIGMSQVVTGAGRYVLWYDQDGGHVGRLTGR
jgi:hypothetical protein